MKMDKIILYLFETQLQPLHRPIALEAQLSPCRSFHADQQAPFLLATGEKSCGPGWPGDRGYRNPGGARSRRRIKKEKWAWHTPRPKDRVD